MIGLKYVDVFLPLLLNSFEGSLMRDQEGLMFHMSGCYLILPKNAVQLTLVKYHF